MNSVKKNVTGWLAALALVTTIGVVPANAQKRDVIAEASAICVAVSNNVYPDAENPIIPDPTLVDACSLLEKTFGVTITGKKAARNKVALLRKISSAILSLDDVFVRGKEEQIETAIRYLLDFADKAGQLNAAGKLEDADADCLIEDAEAIVIELLLL